MARNETALTTLFFFFFFFFSFFLFSPQLILQFTEVVQSLYFRGGSNFFQGRGGSNFFQGGGGGGPNANFYRNPYNL